MPTVRLTDLTIQALKPQEKRLTYFDEALPAFGIRIGRRNKTFIVMKGQSRKRVTIGHYPRISLSEARKQAGAVLYQPDAQIVSTGLLEANKAVSDYLGTLKRRPATIRNYRVYLQGLLAEKCGSTRLKDITPLYLLDLITKSSTPSQTHRVFRAFFSHCVHRLLLERSPMLGLRNPQTSEPRTRVLSDNELRLIWQACDSNSLPPTFSLIVRLLILTGQRRGEITAIQPSWLQNENLVIPANVAKNGREHSIPLSVNSLQLATRLATSRLSSLTPYAAWSRPKKKLDAKSGVSDWTLHDLRRTYATIHGRIGTPIHITEKLLNHVSGSHAGIVGVYQRYAYADEMREAQLKYEAEIARIVMPA